jgi:hypothetical protein
MKSWLAEVKALSGASPLIEFQVERPGTRPGGHDRLPGFHLGTFWRFDSDETEMDGVNDPSRIE